jgi:hypothetical protein
MIDQRDEARWRELELNADLPDVQEVIRQEIRRGTIRVRPTQTGGILIMPVGIHEAKEPIEVEAPPVPSQAQSGPTRTVVRAGRQSRR